MPGRWSVVLLALASLGLSCASPHNTDAGVTADTVDHGPTDTGPAQCASDLDCTDRLYCNGDERCAPGTAGADLRGCVPSDPPVRCAAGQTCDEDAARCRTVCADSDHDGHSAIACGGDDCDDADANRFPGNAETCDAAGHDEDCSPCTVAGARPDGDQDGDLVVSSACTNAWPDATQPAGCDPSALRAVPPSGAVPGQMRGADCVDDPAAGGASIRPNVPEVCGNGVDDNCDGQVDYAEQLYEDRDNDGRGNPAVVMAGTCRAGWVVNALDCDDARPETYRDARELCDGRDNDCSLGAGAAGGPDPAEDRDGDGHSAVFAMCLGRGDPGVPGFAFARDDCNDTVATVYTGAMEVCTNGVDDDCDGAIDNPVQRTCRDRDGDGHGDPTTLRTIMSCAIPAGEVTVCDDCDDTSSVAARRFPGNREVCDLVDNDCAETAAAALEDWDLDGYADTRAACAGGGTAGVPPGTFPRTDCNDADRTIHPTAREVCDRIDSDCTSGGILAADEDGDNDGHSPVTASCLGAGDPGAPPFAYARNDCDDTRATVHGGLTGLEDVGTCDGLDNDCDPSTSELTMPDGCPSGAVCSSGGVCTRGAVPAQLALGSDHTCAAMRDGTVYCWGGNDWGQLGDGTTTTRTRPTRVPGLTGVTGVSAGNHFTCALRRDGTVFCWGNNTYSQLGDRTETDQRSPVAVFGMTTAVEIAAGGYFACARLRDGTAQCWGAGESGQLGFGANPRLRAYPMTVTGLTGILRLTAGGWHACARMTDGTVQCWGANVNGQLGDGTTFGRAVPGPVAGLTGVTSVSAGLRYTCARLGDGTLRCWGDNTSGQLGDGTVIERTLPTAVSAVTGASFPGAGTAHTCVRLSDGTARCWGRNTNGQLGDGTRIDRIVPVAVPGLSGVAEVRVGESHSCARTSAGFIQCWGSNAQGQLGIGSVTDQTTPVLVTALAGAVQLAAGSRHTCSRQGDGSLRCWGGNDDGQLGDGSLITTRSSPASVVGVTNVADVQTGADSACLRTSAGAVMCWGENTNGTLGLGDNLSRSTPTAVPSLSGVAWIHTQSARSCAVTTTGSVYCWGQNAAGELGDGTTVNRLTPTLISNWTNVAQFVGGLQHLCARLTDGTVRCAGSNTYGQLGDGTTTAHAVPVAVPGLTGVAELAAGFNFVCARLGDGTVRCWGQGGALGDGTNVTRLTPTAIPGLSGVVQLRGCGGNACTASSDGSVRCWGRNNFGQVGDGSGLERLSPTVVPALAGAVELQVGNNHGCARHPDGTVRCWGGNSSGQLGDGTWTNRLSPVVIYDL